MFQTFEDLELVKDKQADIKAVRAILADHGMRSSTHSNVASKSSTER